MSAREPCAHLAQDGQSRCGNGTLLAIDEADVTCTRCLKLADGTYAVGREWLDHKPCGTPAAYRRHLRREGAPVRCEPCLQAERRASEDKWQDDDWREAYCSRRREQYAAALAAGMDFRQATRAKDQRRAA